MTEEDPDLALIKARKMKEMRKHAAAKQKAKDEEKKTLRPKTDREIMSDYLYDRGDEVLNLAEAQFPIQTKAITSRLVELIKAGEISHRISGGELLSLMRSIGLNVRVNTNIRIEDHGKLVSFSDKLKQGNKDSIQ